MSIEPSTPPSEAPPAFSAEDVIAVALLIAEHSQGRHGVGRVPCPVCTRGVIGYSVARGRGVSVAARCSTAGCVAFLSD